MRIRNFLAFILSVLALYMGIGPSFAAPTTRYKSVATPAPTPVPAVVTVTVISLDRALAILRSLYPHAKISADRSSNSIIVLATPDEVQAMRTVIQGVDVKNPTQATLEIIALRTLKPATLISRLRGLYPNARITAASASSLFVKATPLDMTQIKALIASLDVAPTAAPAATAAPSDTIRILTANPRMVARAISGQIRTVRASVSGSTIIFTGPIEDVSRAKVLAQSLDQPAFGSRYTQIYRLNNIDATSVGDLVSRSYPSVRVTVDRELNALSIYATASEQQRISSAISQLDGAAGGNVNGQSGAATGAAYGSSNIEVIDLQAALPGMNQQNSTTAQDIATAVTQLLGQMAPDLKVTVIANGAQIGLAGSPQSIRLAKDLIARLDRVAPQVVLDTEILELDENVARNLGLTLPGGAINAVFSEMTPGVDPVTGQPGRLIGLQPLQRSAISFTAQLNLLIQKGNARVLADPRITTLSGKTATIRAGDTIAILTSAGGGVGTPVTQQLQTFNTGVTLDITPMVGTNGEVTVALHPVVNSLSGILNGVPQIATRDTQTMVHLRNNETLVIGGLIQESSQNSISKIPLLGDLPVVGRIFSNSNVQYTRNELIIVVTPHILAPGQAAPAPDAVMPGIPTPRPLPTLPPDAHLPNASAANAVIPQYLTTPAPTVVLSPSPAPASGSATLHTPIPTATQAPLPTPSAFAVTNVFEFGAAPQNTFARDSDAPQIFYVRFGPTVIRPGSPVTVSVITTSNVKRLTVGSQGYETSISQVAPSKWQSTFNFNSLNFPPGQQNAQIPITAYRSDGVTAIIQVPISLSQ